VRWIEKQVNFDSTDEGGMMMVSADEDEGDEAIFG
jgi:hypothetical protein